MRTKVRFGVGVALPEHVEYGKCGKSKKVGLYFHNDYNVQQTNVIKLLYS